MDDLSLRDLVIASGACTDSSMNRIRFEGLDYAPVADCGLLREHTFGHMVEVALEAMFTPPVG